MVAERPEPGKGIRDLPRCSLNAPTLRGKMKKKQSQFFVITAPGLEAICGAEAVALGLEECLPAVGGVTFSGGLHELYAANLYLRTATRILVRLGDFKATDFPELFRKTLRLPWGSFLRPDTAIEIRATAHRSRLIHTGRIVETVNAAIERALGRDASSDIQAAFKQLILVRFEEDNCTISCDSSGELLHKRGYRSVAGAAPLRETLAAASLLLLGWDGSIPLCDPLCGSGTIAVEGGLLATHQPPGRYRDFAFMHWPGYRPGLWQALTAAADRQIVASPSAIYASDSDHRVLAVAAQNAQQAGVAEMIDFSCAELQSLPVRSGPGLVLCNPPYGIRLEPGEDLLALYRNLGNGFMRAFPGWTIAFIAPDEHLAAATGLEVRTRARLVNGGLAVALYTAALPSALP
jgi:putative N6-adenine-specific DNA methylase